jgi:hypothetical protein
LPDNGHFGELEGELVDEVDIFSIEEDEGYFKILLAERYHAVNDPLV